MTENRPGNLYAIILFFVITLGLLSCNNNYTPKPRGFFRIDLPEKSYLVFDTTFPYTFEYPVYCNLVFQDSNTKEPFWLTISYPQFNGKLYLSYKEVSNNLHKLSEESRSLVFKHIPKATSIVEENISNTSSDVYGIKYNIYGAGAASPRQFYVSDSTNHFLRGALYFDTEPNNDSLAPVIEFIDQDIRHFTETLRWKPNYR